MTWTEQTQPSNEHEWASGQKNKKKGKKNRNEGTLHGVSDYMEWKVEFDSEHARGRR